MMLSRTTDTHTHCTPQFNSGPGTCLLATVKSLSVTGAGPEDTCRHDQVSSSDSLPHYHRALHSFVSDLVPAGLC